MVNNVPYKALNEWFRKTQEKVVPVVIEGALVQSGSEEQVNTEKPVGNPAATSYKGTIMVTIKTREGLCIQKIAEIIKGRYHRDPLNGDVYMFMSKDRCRVRMVHYERNAYSLHEKSFIKGYKFMKIEYNEGNVVYKVEWPDLVHILESPVVTAIRID